MKKKQISVILFISMFFCLFPFSSAALSKGDIDGDGALSASDARLVLRAAVELERLSPEQRLSADMDYDGEITADDARTTLRASVGLDEPKEIGISGDMKVGLICLHDENASFDRNVINAAREACDRLGITTDRFILRTNIPEGMECLSAAAELAEAGCNLVFADSFGHEDYMIAAAKAYPNTHFFHLGGTKAHTEALDNYHNLYAAVYDGRFLSGVAAGMKLNEMIANGAIGANEAKLGFVGAFPYAEVISGFTAFYLGARSVCPYATMRVKHTWSWYDEAEENKVAAELIYAGCKIISQYSDSLGAPSACAAYGIPNVSYNVSALHSFPYTALINVRTDWTPLFVCAIKTAEYNENLLACDWTGSLAGGSVVTEDLNTNIAAPGTAQAIEEARTALINGETHVFDVSTFTVNGMRLTSYYADVNYDDAFTPDTQVIENGTFMESHFRSAPYFDILIDGIEGGGWDF